MKKDIGTHTRTLEKQDIKLNKKLVNLLFRGIFLLFSGIMDITSRLIIFLEFSYFVKV